MKGKQRLRFSRVSLVAPFVALVALLTGCATIHGVLPAFVPSQPSGFLQAGAARVDITPPPGFAMGGHSIAGQVARGHWLRLFVRSIYIETVDGKKVALVSGDLWSVSAGLADRVTQILGTGSPDCRLSRDQLILAATHTHQSPGNFSSSSLYNTLASKKFGFDQDLFEFMASRIANAVAMSCKTREAAILRFSTMRVSRLARNRSIEAFLQDPEFSSMLEENSDIPIDCTNFSVTPDERSCRAIDPSLSVISILSNSRDSRRTIAVAAFVAVHATAMSHRLTLYSSDLLGAASFYAERALQTASTPPPVVAIFNGAEGDVSPAWVDQDREDVIQLGGLLGGRIASLSGGGGVINGDLRHQFAIQPIADVRIPNATGTELSTFRRPAGGPAALGGAEDGRTDLYKWGCKEGVGYNHSSTSDFQLQQPSALCSLVYAVARLGLLILNGPEAVPMGVYRLGSIAIVTLPGEFTTVMGRRIRAAVRDELGESVSAVLIVGLANEYVSYFASPEEYATQQYEGASTLYGPLSAALLAEYARKLAAAINSGGPPEKPAGPFSYPAGIARSFSPSELESLSVEKLDAHLRAVLFGPSRVVPKWHRYCWKGSAHGLAEINRRSLAVIPRVKIEIESAKDMWQSLVLDGLPEDDDGANLVTSLATWEGAHSSWCSFWIPPKTALASNVRFAVVNQDGTRNYSIPFHWQ